MSKETKVIVRGYNGQSFPSAESAEQEGMLYIREFDTEKEAQIYLDGAQRHDDIINCMGISTNASIKYELIISHIIVV